MWVRRWKEIISNDKQCFLAHLRMLKSEPGDHFFPRVCVKAASGDSHGLAYARKCFMCLFIRLVKWRKSGCAGEGDENVREDGRQ